MSDPLDELEKRAKTQDEVERLRRWSTIAAAAMAVIALIGTGIALWLSSGAQDAVTQIQHSACQVNPSGSECSKLRHLVSRAQILTCRKAPHSQRCRRAIKVACDTLHLAEEPCPALESPRHQPVGREPKRAAPASVPPTTTSGSPPSTSTTVTPPDSGSDPGGGSSTTPPPTTTTTPAPPQGPTGPQGPQGPPGGGGNGGGENPPPPPDCIVNALGICVSNPLD